MAHEGCTILEAHSDEDHWTQLIQELKEFDAWHGDHPGMSAYVGVSERGEFYGGFNSGGEWIQEEDMAADGKTVTDVLIDLVRRGRAYRKQIDDERAEYAREDAEYAATQSTNG